MAVSQASLVRGTAGRRHRGYVPQALFCESCTDLLYKRVAILFAACAVALVAVGAVAASRGHVAEPAVVQGVPAGVIRTQRARPLVRLVVPVHVVRKAQPKPRVRLRATISLYEHTTDPYVLGRQGCRAAKRGVGGVVILDFGKPAYNGHTYGTLMFSNRFASNRKITRALLGYARGYVGCLQRGSHTTISLARGTSNYHPSVPSPRTFWRTRDFYRGYASARAGHLLYNYGSLDGGVMHGIWNVHQAFFVVSGMRYSRAIPEIYSIAMARQWAALARAASRRYHRPVKFAGVMTTHTSANHGLKPLAAHQMLRQELASSMGRGPASYVPPSLTNIVSAD